MTHKHTFFYWWPQRHVFSMASLFVAVGFTLLSSSISCTSGESFFASIAAAEAGADEINLTVSAEAGSASVTSYEAQCEDGSGVTTIASSSDTAIIVSGVETGKDCICVTTATNEDGTSLVSAPSETLTPSRQALPIWLLYEATQL